jgi:hypothetical protein
VKDNWRRYFPQILRAIEQLGGEDSPENYQRKTNEIPGKCIVDGEVPL